MCRISCAMSIGFVSILLLIFLRQSRVVFVERFDIFV